MERPGGKGVMMRGGNEREEQEEEWRRERKAREYQYVRRGVESLLWGLVKVGKI